MSCWDCSLGHKKLCRVTSNPRNSNTRRHFAKLAGLSTTATAEQAIESVYRLLGESTSAVLRASLEDALAVAQRPHVPGTTNQRPNWSHALPATAEDITSARLPRIIADALSHAGSK